MDRATVLPHARLVVPLCSFLALMVSCLTNSVWISCVIVRDVACAVVLQTDNVN